MTSNSFHGNLFGAQSDGLLRVVVTSLDPARAQSITAILERGGYHPIVAQSLELTLELYAEADTDCLIMDMAVLERAPRLDVHRLQRIGTYVPVLAVGGPIPFEEVRRLLRHHDIQAYLPMQDADQLLIAVDGWARRCRVWREVERWTAAHGRTLLESLSAAVIWIDSSGLISEWNGASEKLFGISRVTVLGTPFRSCAIRWGDPSTVGKILAVARGTQATRIDDIPYRKPDGLDGFLGFTVNVVARSQDASELLVLGRDITPHKQHSAQMLQSQKLEAIGQLAAGVAHEINTPTQYVGDNLNFLRDAFGELTSLLRDYAAARDQLAGTASREVIAALDKIGSSVDLQYLLEQIPNAIAQSVEGNERVGQIVRAMKDFSHPGTVEKTSVDLNEGVRNTVTVSRNEWKYLADIRLELDPALPKVYCLASEINQVLLNLIVNASHAIADVVRGTDNKGSIVIRTRVDGDHVLMQVTDSGGGIPENIRSRIFDPFFTTKEVGKGTGQGLAIARSVVVDKHQGTIDVESTVGVGTTFNVRLPIGEVRAG
jgi:two-component system, NtrC family, sensor kinase